MAAEEPFCSQMHGHHGMNVAVLARPDGTALWYPRALPGRSHDLTAARAHGVIQAMPDQANPDTRRSRQ
ncbi:transposase family protein [Streptomyces sp. NPDC059680]|uniref:transposase family protein n=1 Tax=Streptomyces sp. NPDC059680 TaxID=3346904 RepID=UPI0036B0390A